MKLKEYSKVEFWKILNDIFYINFGINWSASLEPAPPLPGGSLYNDSAN